LSLLEEHNSSTALDYNLVRENEVIYETEEFVEPTDEATIEVYNDKWELIWDNKPKNEIQS
jgi:hypothetical protein